MKQLHAVSSYMVKVYILAFVKALGAPQAEEMRTLWRGWYQKSYPNCVVCSLQVPLTWNMYMIEIFKSS